jgi:hypothetical protein
MRRLTARARSLYSGFWAMVLLAERQTETMSGIILRATLRTGLKVERQLAEINLRPEEAATSLE